MKNLTRTKRTRYKLKKITNRERLTVFKSNNHIYAQIINDEKGITLASASSLEKSFKDGKGRELYSDEWEEKLMNFSKTMIQQIDTLTRIANAFSDFASLSAQSLEKICIIKEVETCLRCTRKVFPIPEICRKVKKRKEN